MKNNILSFILILCSCTLTNAQIVIEQTYQNTDVLRMVKIDSVSYKYLDYNENDSILNVTLYNLDHSIFKTFSINILPYAPTQWFDPTNLFTSAGASTYFFSRYLFDTNNDIDFMCQVVFSYQDSSFNGYDLGTIIIFNEDGTNLFSESDAWLAWDGSNNAPNCIYNTDEGAKMILEVQNDRKVYGLPGLLVTKMNPSTNNDFSFSAYPNPSICYTKIEYSLPSYLDKAELAIYNLKGQVVKKYQVDSTFDHLKIFTNEFVSGTYYYCLQSNNQLLGVKKMIVVK